MMFPLWLFQWLVIGGLVMCCAGVTVLVVFLISDSKQKRIW